MQWSSALRLVHFSCEDMQCVGSNPVLDRELLVPFTDPAVLMPLCMPQKLSNSQSFVDLNMCFRALVCSAERIYVYWCVLVGGEIDI